MADSLLRQRATVHTSCWSWCLAASLCSGLKEQRLARLISLHSATSNCTGVLVSPIQSESCVTQVGSPVVCSSYNIFCSKWYCSHRGQATSCTVPLPPQETNKKETQKAAQAVSTEVLISLCFLSLPPAPPILRVPAKQSGLAPKHNYENGPLGCFF